ncbi:MAG TPA: type III-B CRISPR-associated protein Cas10/Cmr2 [Armatimonadetes bacterium]|nr:type III-B CRISPR-associated protein Cas10/Cmr2 [Armatimonadota bacterium]
MGVNWRLKVSAFLHDPPDKALDILGHEERGAALRKQAIGVDFYPDEVKQADAIASSADRIGVVEGLKLLEWPQRPFFVHPLSGRSLEVEGLPDPARSSEAQMRAVRTLTRRAKGDERRLFLLLWRFLDEELKHEERRDWEALPADTRIPDHGLLQHLSAVSAVAASLPSPAMLIFTIGPVQSFIATARRTEDLWAGSYILSFLIWRGIKVVAEEFGPDHIIFPWLKGQPLVDLWLEGEIEGVEKPSLEALEVASLPNRFVAILPSGEAEKVAQEAEGRVRQAWGEISQMARRRLERGAGGALQGYWEELWERQTSLFPEIYWAVIRWPDEAGGVIELYKRLLILPEEWEFEKVYQVVERKVRDRYGRGPEVGSCYSLLYDVCERALSSRKATRDFAPVEERGWKCSLCGRLEALKPQPERRRKEVKEFWATLAERVRPKFREKGRERLCAVCATKRLFRDEYFADLLESHNLARPRGFPSTSTIASSGWTRSLLERLSERPSDELIESLKGFLDSLEKLGPEKVPQTGMGVPYLDELADRINHGEARSLARRLLKFDGEWLYPETFRRARAEEVLERDEAEEMVKRLERLYKASGLGSPPTYFAILVADGDDMGKWLSGRHKDMPKLAEILHPHLDKKALGDAANLRRLLTPALHGAISEALSHFSLKFAPLVVQRNRPGRLIYSGGDDVLALLPIEDALEAARELRALFSGEARIMEGRVQPMLGSKEATGWIRFEGRLLPTMGPRASLSVGICIAHHLHPLDHILEMAREALEEGAKGRWKRNAVCVRWLKRSGEEVEVGTKFVSEGPWHKGDVLELFAEIVELFEDGRLSGRMPFILLSEALPLTGVGREAREAEFARLLQRHGLDKKEALQLAPKLAALSVEFDEFTKGEGVKQVGLWLSLLRFLAQRRGGE